MEYQAQEPGDKQSKFANVSAIARDVLASPLRFLSHRSFQPRTWPPLSKIFSTFHCVLCPPVRSSYVQWDVFFLCLDNTSPLTVSFPETIALSGADATYCIKLADDKLPTHLRLDLARSDFICRTCNDPEDEELKEDLRHAFRRPGRLL
jgi:hypothetical protein